MKVNRRQFVPLGRLLFWLFVLGLSCGTAGACASVLVVKGGSDTVHEQVFASLHQALEDGPNNGIGVELVDVDGWRRLADEPGNLAAYELIVSIGTRATDAVMALDAPRPPLLASFLPRRTLDQLLVQYRSADGQVTALVLDQPLARQLALARLLMGRHPRIGVMLGADSSDLARELDALAARQHLSLRLLRLAPEEKPGDRFRELLPGLDLVLGLPDPQVFDRVSSKWILYSSYQARVPVLAYSKALVKAGALAAVYSTPKQIGNQSAALVRGLLANPGGAVPSIVYPDAFDLALNRAVARSLGLAPPSEASLRQELSAVGGGGAP